MKKSETTARTIWKNFSFLLVLAAIVLVYLVSGIRMCAVVSGSMEPNLPTWSLCFVNTRTDYEDIQIGDIVVYIRRADGKRIIHRVVEITEEGMVTKGDHNKIDDGVSVTEDNLFGKEMFFIPKLGRLPMLVKTPAGLAVVGVLLLLLLLSTFKDIREEKAKEQSAEEPEKQEEQAEPEKQEEQE